MAVVRAAGRAGRSWRRRAASRDSRPTSLCCASERAADERRPGEGHDDGPAAHRRADALAEPTPAARRPRRRRRPPVGRGDASRRAPTAPGRCGRRADRPGRHRVRSDRRRRPSGRGRPPPRDRPHTTSADAAPRWPVRARPAAAPVGASATGPGRRHQERRPASRAGRRPAPRPRPSADAGRRRPVTRLTPTARRPTATPQADRPTRPGGRRQAGAGKPRTGRARRGKQRGPTARPSAGRGLHRRATRPSRPEAQEGAAHRAPPRRAARPVDGVRHHVRSAPPAGSAAACGRPAGAFRHEYALVTYAGLLLAVALTWPTLRYPLHTVPAGRLGPGPAGLADRLVRAHPADRPGAALAVQRVLPRALQLRLRRQPARLRPGRDARQRARWPRCCATTSSSCWPTRCWRSARYALVRQLGAGRTGAAVAGGRRSPTRRGGSPRRATSTSSRPAASRWPWRCWPAGTAGRCGTGSGPTAGTPAGPRPAGWWRPGRSASASRWGCRSPTSWPVILLVLVIGVPIRRWRRPSQRPVLGWRLLAADALGALIFAGVGR